MAKYLFFCLILLSACNRANTSLPPSTPLPPPPPIEFWEVRIHRWIALYGGEIFILRRVGPEWSAELLGDATRFRCFYQKSVRPKSDWNALYGALIAEGLGELSGAEPPLDVEDGDGFTVEVRDGKETRRYSVDHPSRHSSQNAKRILRIGDLISKEFDTPIFAGDYNSGQFFDYLDSPCRKD